MIRILCKSFIVLLMAISPAMAGVFLLDENSVSQLYLTPYISHYQGSAPLPDSDAASALPDSEFTPVGSASPVRLREEMWFRLKVQNNSAQHRSLVLDFDQALFSHIVWDARTDTSRKFIVTGQSYPYASRDIDYDYFAFRLDIPQGETLTINFSIRTPFAVLFVPKLYDSDKFISSITFTNRLSGAVMGMLYSVVFFLFIYIVQRRKETQMHLMFGFSFACMLSVLYVNGAIQRALPEVDFPLRDIVYVLIHGFQGMMFCLILRIFYQTRYHHPVFDKVLLGIALAEMLVVLLSFFIEIEPLLLSTVALNSFVMLVSLLLASLTLYQRRSETYIFTVGLLGLILLSLISTLGSFGVVSVSYLTRYGYELGLTVLVDFLFLAIVLRIFSAEREKWP